MERNLRDAFLEVCPAQDKPGAQAIRESMREYIERHAPMVEQGLAGEEQEKPRRQRVDHSNVIRKIGGA